MNQDLINIVGQPNEINSLTQALSELSKLKKALSIKSVTPSMLECIAARGRYLWELYPEIRNDIRALFDAVIQTKPEDVKIMNTNFKVGSRHSATWWQKEAERLYKIIKPTIKNFTIQKTKKQKRTDKAQKCKSSLRNDIPIYIITGITGKKQPIEEALGFEVNEILAERWAPNLKRIQAVCEAAQKSSFGIIAFLCKNTCHSVSEVAIKKTKGISNWKVIKIFKNNTAEIAATIKSAIATAGIADQQTPNKETLCLSKLTSTTTQTS